MERRSPLKIAVESLSESRDAAARGDLGDAYDALVRGVAALGPLRRGRVLDPSGLGLAVAGRARAEGRLEAAVAAIVTVLEERIAEYEGREGAAS